MGRKSDNQFICSQCSAQFTQWVGKCTSCGTWDSLSPLAGEKYTTVRRAGKKKESLSSVKYCDLPAAEMKRIPTGIEEFDRVLGGGIVPGSLILLGGEPGVGKSTILLQASDRLASSGIRTLFVTGEESSAQIRIRGERLRIDDSELYFLAETELESIMNEVEALEPGVVIIDSIQTVRSNRLERGAGSTSQIRETANRLLEYAKMHNIPFFITGHVTKEGVIAGPKMIEHIVDTVLYFEGEKNYNHRIIRAAKNRFGPIGEIGIFEMREEGLVPVERTSELFINRSVFESPGSVLFPAREGTRPLLVEIQALVSISGYSTPRRTVVGLDYNRTILVLAIMEKRLGVDLSSREVFLSVTGGVLISEPAVDLAVAAAVLSSYTDRPVKKGTAVFGELGLTGEVRGVSGYDDRIKESESYNTKQIIAPGGGKNASRPVKSVDLIGVVNIQELKEHLF